jgi:Tfp pilus assembly protein PilO
MLRNFNPLQIRWQSVVKDPRVTVRVAMGVLLAANLVMAVMAFKPFGGSAEDLARQESARETELDTWNKRIHTTKQMVEKVQGARTAGDQFLAKYFMERRSTTSQILEELQRIATDSGVNAGPDSFQIDDIEGSDSLKMIRLQVGCEGNYQSIAKFVNLLDKSPHFLIVENMHANAVQNGQKVNVSFKVDTFAKDDSGAGL